MSMNRLSEEVTSFLDSKEHPLRTEIEYLRNVIMSSRHELKEGIKWNGPNYSHEGEDRITMRIQPQKQLQVIFHRGAKVKTQPDHRLLEGKYSFLVWKENDRAIATFRDMDDILQNVDVLREMVNQWIEATEEKTI